MAPCSADGPAFLCRKAGSLAGRRTSGDLADDASSSCLTSSTSGCRPQHTQNALASGSIKLFTSKAPKPLDAPKSDFFFPNYQSIWKKVILDFKMSDLEGQLSQKRHHLYKNNRLTLLSRMLLYKESDFF